ncbi:MAG: pilus assembly protein PilM [Bdellovibrionales bacterium]|nr:pilus assembly protein PilM [Bdellovibrionales bacterium]
MKSVGIDIGNYSIKVAEIESTSKGFSIQRFQEFPLNLDPAKDIEIDIIEHLREIASQYDSATTHFVVGMNQNTTSSRYLNFPFKDRYKILKTLPFELEEDIPFQIEDALFDAKIVRYVGETSDVLAVTSTKENVSEILSQMADGQIDPYAVAPKGIALANLFEAWNDSPLQIEAPLEETETPEPVYEPAEVFLDIGHHGSTVVIMRGRALVQVRTITWGGSNLAKAISTKYQMHFVDAIKELNKNAFILNNNEGATQDQVVFSNLLKTEFDELGRKLRLVLLEAKTQHKLEFTGIRLLGGVSQVQNVGLYLTQLTEIPTNRLHQLAHFPELDLNQNSQNEVSLLTALGLAIDGLRKRKNPGVNLRKEEFERQSKFFLKKKKKWGYSIKVVAATFVAFFIYSFLIDSFSSDLNDASYEALKDKAKKVANLKGRAATPKKIKSYIKSKVNAAKNAELAEELNEINSTMDILKKITQLTPKGRKMNIDVSRLNIDNDLVEIVAQTDDKTQMELLKSSLAGFSSNSKVDVSGSRYDGSRKKQIFTFKFRVDRKTKDL